MRALLQRVVRASVTIDGIIAGQIGRGILVLLGVTHADTEDDAERLARKVMQLRIFPDNESKMNLSLMDVRGELLVVSQFTLYADAQKGNRPSYSQAAPPDIAQRLYANFVDSCRSTGLKVQTGRFQAHMLVELINDGPVTILCESKSK